jgi:hypothetical protein
VVEAAGSRIKRQALSAGLHGQFEAEVPGNRSVPLSIVVTATSPGYTRAEDTIEVKPGNRAGSIGLVLRRQPDDPDLPDLEELCAKLLPKLRAPLAGDPLTGVPPQQLDYALHLLEEDEPETAAPLLAEVVRRNPGCVPCAALAGLAELETGAWSSANSHLMQAAHAAAMSPDKGHTSGPFIALGELQIWRGELSKAAVSFMQALAREADQPLALQELGRTFLLEGRASVADRYLARALDHGGDAEGHLLRAQALAALDEPGNAHIQLATYLAGRKPKELPERPRAIWTKLTSRIALESRGGGATIVDHSPEEVAAARPELQGLTSVDGSPALDSLLRKVGQGVQGIFQGFPNTSVDEEIEMQRLHADGRLADSVRQHFRYLLISSVSSDSLVLNEFRTDASSRPVSPGLPGRDFMVTSGFASIPLVFHPSYQAGSGFRLLGRQRINGRDTLVLAFAERPATAKMLEEFVMSERRAVVLTQGLAWLDAETFQILRMRTDLLKPASEIRLSAQTTDVRYGPVHFKSKDQTLWLPQDVAVTVHWNGKIYRNLHHYSGYQLFQVGTQERTQALKVRGLWPVR